MVCPGDGTAPPKCDDSAFGKGTGGRLNYDVSLKPGHDTTVWFTVAGSDQGPAAARAEYARASNEPGRALRSKVDEPGGARPATRRSTCRATGCCSRASTGASRTSPTPCRKPHDMKLRDVDEGKAYPAPSGTLDKARWLGAGFPDYPWMFGTDGEYTAFAAVAAGQFDPIKSHLRALRDVSEIVNAHSGKVAHEIVHTGDVYFGVNADAGNTDETVKFPSAVALVWRWTGDDRFRDDLYDFAVRNLKYVDANLDTDGDGWLEGLGNVERSGMGEEKLDNTAYYIRGLLDLADMAASKGDDATESWASEQGGRPPVPVRGHLVGAAATRTSYAESIDDPAEPGERQHRGLPAALDRRDADGDRAAGRQPAGRAASTARPR